MHTLEPVHVPISFVSGQSVPAIPSSVAPLQSLSTRSHTSADAAGASHAVSPPTSHARCPEHVPTSFVIEHAVDAPCCVA